MRVALISDIHGNRVALETVLAAIEQDAPGPDRLPRRCRRDGSRPGRHRSICCNRSAAR